MSIFKKKEQEVILEEKPKALSLKDIQEVIVEEGFEVSEIGKKSITFKDENSYYRVLKDFKMIYLSLTFNNEPDEVLPARSNYLNGFLSPIKLYYNNEDICFSFSSYCETKETFKKVLEFAITQLDVQLSRYQVLINEERLQAASEDANKQQELPNDNSITKMVS